MSNPTLTTLDQCKAYLEIEDTSYDELLNQLLVSASDQIRSWCRIDFSQAQYVEIYAGDNSPYLPLANRPVTSLIAITRTGSNQPPLQFSNFWFNQISVGQRCDVFHRGFDRYQVTYVAGYPEIPDDIQDACVYLVASKYREKDRIGINSKATGSETITFELAALPQRVKDAIQQYKDPIPVLYDQRISRTFL